jgi:hypothetical protein
VAGRCAVGRTVACCYNPGNGFRPFRPFWGRPGKFVRDGSRAFLPPAAKIPANRPFPSAAGSARDAQEAGGRPRPVRQQKLPICSMFSTGATGLEPAISGVTDRRSVLADQPGGDGSNVISRLPTAPRYQGCDRLIGRGAPICCLVRHDLSPLPNPNTQPTPPLLVTPPAIAGGGHRPRPLPSRWRSRGRHFRRT